MCALGTVAYAGWRMNRLPKGHPAAILAQGGPPAERPVLVCLGDSITQGGIGTNWVDRLRQSLHNSTFVINAGVNGQVAWNLRQRLDEIAHCKPDAIALLIGSNDAVGALNAEWAGYYQRNQNLPQAPTEAWYAEQYDALVAELVTLTPRLVCLTLPPLGEDPATPAESIARRHNVVIRASAARHGADVLDVHTALRDLQQGASSGVPFAGSMSKFVTWMMSSAFQHYVLGLSWDRIAQRRGLVLTCDTIHLADRSGEAVLDLLEPWVQTALGVDAEQSNKP